VNAPSSFRAFLSGLFPKAGGELLELYEQAAVNAGLLHTDYYTIRDLLDLSGYGTDEALHALLLIMTIALNEGSPCVEVSAARLARRLGDVVEEGRAQAWANRIIADLGAGAFPALIGAGMEDGRPLIRRHVGDKTYVYFQKFFKYESVLLTEMQKRLAVRSGARPQAPATAWPAIVNDVLVTNPVHVGGRPLQLSRGQQLALGVALLGNFAVISGGPGTGKTSIVFTLLRCLVRSGVPPQRIALAAPTGRAAQRLTDAVHGGLAGLAKAEEQHSTSWAKEPDASLKDLTAHTLHHLLGYQPSRGTFGRHAENPLPADVVIVDEVSMVGLVLMAQLLQATRPETRLILLGDKDQLPSVEAGTLLTGLFPEHSPAGFSAELCGQLALLFPQLRLARAGSPHPLRDVTVVLDENYRSEKQIQEVAEAVNRQDADVVDRLPSWPVPAAVENGGSRCETSPMSGFQSPLIRGQPAGCFLVDTGASGIAEWKRFLTHWAECHYLANGETETYAALVERCIAPEETEIAPAQKDLLEALFATVGQARVLTSIREGPWGCVGINRYMEQVFRPRLDPKGGGQLFAGAPVLILRNDYFRSLFNGDVGVTLRGAGGGYRVVFQRRGSFISFASDALPAHELAFAMTIHKSQGSEYERILLVLPQEGGRRLLTKELLYTGITRAKRLAILCAAKDTLRRAVERRVERESGQQVG
jgi:exodeoxyribonuclease V alpha subunit